MPSVLPSVFAQLRTVLAKHAGALTVKTDTASCYCLEGGLHPKHQTPMPIAWVQLGKAYVSYHLMPIYGCPELLDRFSPDLRAHMQGKSCFNFRSVDPALFAELDQLTAQGLKVFKKAGYL